MEKTVIELFAGVGGFRVGLNKIVSIDENGKAIENGNFSFVWANQWEPSTKNQHAFDCYALRFGDIREDSNTDITQVDKSTIPDHTLLVGGFPCQDYSVAHSLTKEKGIEGKKGVLWWQINDILKTKKPPFVLLENVDRLLKSPARQRGRDFGIILKCLFDQGYEVEWRVINAADYGHAQRRRRTFIFATKKENKYSDIYKEEPSSIISSKGFFADIFPIEEVSKDSIKSTDYSDFEDLVEISNKFKFEFMQAGVMIDGIIYTSKINPIKCSPKTLGQIAEEGTVDDKYFLDEKKQKQFEFLRGGKRILRKKPNGEDYYYSEGAMSPYDSFDLPGRTMLTSEGSINRSTHIVMDKEKSALRLLTPIECERLNGFPDNWTNSGMPEKRRYFMMGNALVCNLIETMGTKIEIIIEGE